MVRTADAPRQDHEVAVLRVEPRQRVALKEQRLACAVQAEVEAGGVPAAEETVRGERARGDRVACRGRNPRRKMVADEPPVLLLLDELANIAPFPGLAELASTAAGMGVQLVSVCQDVAQLQAVQALGCRYAQGFLLGRPQPMSAIARSLRRAAA